MSQPDYQPSKPFETSMESWTSGLPDDWPNAVTVSVTTAWKPTPEGIYPLAEDREFDDGQDYADSGGEHELVQIDTNYKSSRPGDHPVRLTRTDAIQVAAHVLTAAEDTFHYRRRGRLRATEAAAVLRALEEIDQVLIGLRGHALDDLLQDTGIAATELEEPEPDDTASGADPEEVVDNHSATTEVIGITAAVRDVFPADVAQQIEASDAFGALAYRVLQRVAATGQTPTRVLRDLDPSDRAFASRANEPAAFLAAKIRDLDHEGR